MGCIYAAKFVRYSLFFKGQNISFQNNFPVILVTPQIREGVKKYGPIRVFYAFPKLARVGKYAFFGVFLNTLSIILSSKEHD